eukprot:956667_1
MGGHYRIAIESVLFSGKGGQYLNFEVFFRALCKLNAMFNGSYVSKKDLSRHDRLVLSSLIKWKLGEKDIDGKIDQYMLNTFNAFCQHKRHIVLHYFDLYNKNDAVLVNTIFYRMEKGLVAENNNIFRKELFTMFQNITNIEIYTTSYIGSYPRKFSFDSLLTVIENERWSRIQVKAVKSRDGNSSSWIGDLWRETSEKLQQTYSQKKKKIKEKH